METRLLTLNDFIRPKQVKCSRCGRMARLDLGYYPGPGLDPRLRRYFCECKKLIYQLAYKDAIPKKG